MKEWARRLDYDAGSFALAQGDLVAAEREYQAFLAGLAPDDRALALPARLHLAEIAARQGTVARAESLANAAFDDLDRWRGQVDDRTLRLQALALRELDLDPGLGLPVIAGAVAAEGRAEAALALVERGRGRELADAQLRLGSWAGTGTSAVREAQPARSFVPDSATAVIEFVVGGPTEPTLALLLTRGAVRAFAGPPVGGLEDAVARFRGLVESGADPARLDRGFTATLIGPVLEAIPPGITTLVIVPDGPLHRVPFDALKLSGNELVVDRFAVVVTPSVSTIQPAPPVQSTAPTLVLAIANPLLGNPADQPARAESDLFRRSFAAAGGLPPIPASEGEARRAARVAPGSTLRLRADASESLVQAGAARPVHPDPHRRPRRGERRRPRRLGGGTGTGRRGGWLRHCGRSGGTALRAELVVLSSCRTAGGVVMAGEGLQGLTAPLLRAGARAVLATSWQVRDRDASRFTALLLPRARAGWPGRHRAGPRQTGRARGRDAGRRVGGIRAGGQSGGPSATGNVTGRVGALNRERRERSTIPSSSRAVTDHR